MWCWHFYLNSPLSNCALLRLASLFAQLFREHHSLFWPGHEKWAQITGTLVIAVVKLLFLNIILIIPKRCISVGGTSEQTCIRYFDPKCSLSVPSPSFIDMSLARSPGCERSSWPGRPLLTVEVWTASAQSLTDHRPGQWWVMCADLATNREQGL